MVHGQSAIFQFGHYECRVWEADGVGSSADEGVAGDGDGDFEGVATRGSYRGFASHSRKSAKSATMVATQSRACFSKMQKVHTLKPNLTPTNEY